MPTPVDDKQKSIRLTLFTGLGRTLFVSLLLFSLLPLSVEGLLSYKRGKAIRLEKEVQSLQAAVNLRTFYLASYFQERINDLILHADFSENIALLQKLQVAFSESGLPLEKFIQTYRYISIVTEHGDDIQEFQELANDYHDILLIDSQGNILHSVAAEANLGTNIFSGPYRDTELARVSRKTMDLGQTLCSDLSIHESSGNQKSLFATQVMVDEVGDMIGIMVMQITMDQINSIMTDATGLGETGQIFLVGNDSTLRSRLRRDESKSVLGDKIESPLITQWLEREKIRHGPDQGRDKKELPVLSEAVFYQGQSHMPTLALSRDIDSLGIYDVHWMMIAEIDEAEAFAASNDLGDMILSTLLITAVLVSFLAAFITRRMILPLSTITDWARKVAQGDLTVLPIKTQDNEIGTLYQAMTEMVAALKKMIALKDQQDWLKSGEAGLNNAMQGVQNLTTLGQNILNYTCKYLQLQVGAFYLLDEEYLRFTAGYAYTVPEDGDHGFTLGEGLVGQAALEKKIILFEDVPHEHINLQIRSGFGTSFPQSILVLPLLQEEQLIGVLEFGIAGTFTKQAIQFLEKIAPVVAITINTALAGQNVQRLLVETQRQGHELQKRQEELKASNDELQEKTDFLEKQRSEIAAAKKDVEDKARDLEQASTYKSEFLANMSHELRSPLNSLLILAQSLAENDEGNLTAEQVEEARIIHSGGLDLLNLINDILDLSKVEAGRIDIYFTEMTFSDLVQDLENQFLPLARAKHLSFSIRRDPHLSPVMVTDEQRLKQILKNLLSNSIKFTTVGSVGLTIQPAPAETRFHRPELATAEVIAFMVTDTGIGIPDDKQRDIFEAFQQGDGSTSRKYGGTGLGLTISRHFAELMGGEIQLESRQGEGSTFTLYLPAVSRAPSSPGSRTEDVLMMQDPAAPSSAKQLQNGVRNEIMLDEKPPVDDEALFYDKKILVVDDDMRNSFAMANLLKKFGMKVELAAHGRQALEKLAEDTTIDLVLMDIMMPGMDGYEAIRQIRGQQQFKKLPVIALTAKAMPEDRQVCLDSGANGYLTKPLDTEKLFVLMGRLLVK